jgi:hypothetical protein
MLKKSSPLKLLSQSQPDFAEMILRWSPFKIVSVSTVLYPRWLPLLKIEISSNDQNCFLICIIGQNRQSSKFIRFKMADKLVTWVFALQFSDNFTVLWNEIKKIIHIYMLRTLLSTSYGNLMLNM